MWVFDRFEYVPVCEGLYVCMSVGFGRAVVLCDVSDA